MSEHYYTKNPQSPSNPEGFSVELFGKRYHFLTDSGVFSRGELDTGSALLISCLPCEPGDMVLDLGCGYGPIGLVAADLVSPQGHAYLVEINERAVALARENQMRNRIDNATILASDGLAGLHLPELDYVLTNPPIRAGKAVIYDLIKQAKDKLKDGGSLLVVIRTKQGAKSMEKELATLFHQVETVKKESGFRVLQGVK